MLMTFTKFPISEGLMTGAMLRYLATLPNGVDFEPGDDESFDWYCAISDADDDRETLGIPSVWA